uniref:CSON008339 protein n=1 Tax=Culicoides sonorensis TaxID=179676 RepID=A0A336LF55_CULSO
MQLKIFLFFILSIKEKVLSVTFHYEQPDLLIVLCAKNEITNISLENFRSIIVNRPFTNICLENCEALSLVNLLELVSITTPHLKSLDINTPYDSDLFPDLSTFLHLEKLNIHFHVVENWHHDKKGKLNLPETFIVDILKNTSNTLKELVLKANYSEFDLLIHRKDTWHLNNKTFAEKLLIKTISIQENVASIANDTFKELRHLTTLGLIKQKLNQFNVEILPPFLKNLDLSNNTLSSLPINESLNLIELRLDNNQFESLTLDLELKLPNLEKMSLFNNPLKTFHIKSGEKKQISLKYLNLRKTLLHTPDMWIWAYNHRNSVKTELQQTFILCDCTFINVIQNITKYWNSSKFETQCQGSLTLNIRVNMTDLQCSVDQKFNQHTNCTIYNGVSVKNPEKSFNMFFDCSNTDTPFVEPQIERELLQNRRFFTRNHKINVILKFKNNPSVKRLPKIRDIFKEYTNIFYHIYGENSSISKITIENVPETNLVELFLANNLIEEMPLNVIGHLSEMKTNITLSNNLLLCDCSHLEMYQKISSLQIFDFDQMICTDRKPFLSDRELCIPAWKVFLYLTLGLVTLLAIGLAIYLRHSLEIQVFIYSRGWFPAYFRPESDDAEYQFDVFLSFSEKDDEFASSILKLLEEDQDPPFKVCYHHRDWMVGERIDHQIISSVEESRKTVIIISQSFLSSHWANMEFTTAHYKMLEEKSPKILLILHGEIDTADLGPELKSYIKTTTYLKSDDKWFEKKLLYSLRR